MINDDFDADARREAERALSELVSAWRPQGITEVDIELFVAALVTAFHNAPAPSLDVEQGELLH